MSQEDIRKILVKNPGKKFGYKELDEKIDTGVNNIRVNLAKIFNDVQKKIEDEIKCDKLNFYNSGHLVIVVWVDK